MLVLSSLVIRVIVSLAILFTIARLIRHNSYNSRIRIKGVNNFPRSAGNSTLGFHKIASINLPHRYDYDDAIVLQSLVSNITLDRYLGVDGESLEEAGLPPSSSTHGPEPLSKNQQACFRAHANLWREMIENSWQTLLIMESDAMWDVDIKDQMRYLSVGLNDLMRKYPSTVETAVGERQYAEESLIPTEADPYCSSNWDILSLGQCFEHELNSEQFVVYHDPYGVMVSIHIVIYPYRKNGWCEEAEDQLVRLDTQYLVKEQLSYC